MYRDLDAGRVGVGGGRTTTVTPGRDALRVGHRRRTGEGITVVPNHVDLDASVTVLDVDTVRSLDRTVVVSERDGRDLGLGVEADTTHLVVVRPAVLLPGLRHTGSHLPGSRDRHAVGIDRRAMELDLDRLAVVQAGHVVAGLVARRVVVLAEARGREGEDGHRQHEQLQQFLHQRMPRSRLSWVA